MSRFRSVAATASGAGLMGVNDSLVAVDGSFAEESSASRHLQMGGGSDWMADNDDESGSPQRLARDAAAAAVRRRARELARAAASISSNDANPRQLDHGQDQDSNSSPQPPHELPTSASGSAASVSAFGSQASVDADELAELEWNPRALTRRQLHRSCFDAWRSAFKRRRAIAIVVRLRAKAAGADALRRHGSETSRVNQPANPIASHFSNNFLHA
jgi:hypothetical protein